MLVRTSFNDSQVMYWEPAKYVAKMRALRPDHNTVILKTNMSPAGHGGASGRYDRLHETAFDYAYFLTQMGIQDSRAEPAAAIIGRSALAPTPKPARGENPCKGRGRRHAR
jgi:hypothetical protein